MRDRLRARRSPVFYGWWIVLAGWSSLLLSGALYFHSFGAYAAVLEARFGWSKGAIGGAFSLARVEGGLLGPISGWLIDKKGPRFVFMLGFFIFGLGFILASQINSLPVFYITFLVISIGSSLTGFLLVTTAINHWFRRRRSLAFGLALTGTGVAGVLVPVIVWSLNTQGWVVTTVGAGVFIWLVGIPLGMLMRGQPEQYGLQPDGAPPPVPASTEPGESAAAETGDDEEVDFTAREAMRTHAFWFLGLGHGLALMAVSVVSVHQFLFMQQELGFSPQATAQVVSVLTLVTIAGRVVAGVGGMWVAPRWLCAGSMVGHGLGMLFLVTADSVPQAMLYAVFHGLGWGTRGVVVNSIRGDYFGRKAFATISGYNNLLMNPGQIIAPVLAGLAADLTGSYSIALYSLVGTSALGALLFAAATKPKPPARATG